MGDAKGVKGDERSCEEDEGLIRIPLRETDAGAHTGDKNTVPEDNVERRLHDGCFQSKDALFAKKCNHEVSEGWKL